MSDFDSVYLFSDSFPCDMSWLTFSYIFDLALIVSEIKTVKKDQCPRWWLHYFILSLIFIYWIHHKISVGSIPINLLRFRLSKIWGGKSDQRPKRSRNKINFHLFQFDGILSKMLSKYNYITISWNRHHQITTMYKVKVYRWHSLV